MTSAVMVCPSATRWQLCIIFVYLARLHAAESVAIDSPFGRSAPFANSTTCSAAQSQCSSSSQSSMPTIYTTTASLPSVSLLTYSFASSSDITTSSSLLDISSSSTSASKFPCTTVSGVATLNPVGMTTTSQIATTKSTTAPLYSTSQAQTSSIFSAATSFASRVIPSSTLVFASLSSASTINATPVLPSAQSLPSLSATTSTLKAMSTSLLISSETSIASSISMRSDSYSATVSPALLSPSNEAVPLPTTILSITSTGSTAFVTQSSLATPFAASYSQSTVSVVSPSQLQVNSAIPTSSSMVVLSAAPAMQTALPGSAATTTSLLVYGNIPPSSLSEDRALSSTIMYSYVSSPTSSVASSAVSGLASLTSTAKVSLPVVQNMTLTDPVVVSTDVPPATVMITIITTKERISATLLSTHSTAAAVHALPSGMLDVVAYFAVIFGGALVA